MKMTKGMKVFWVFVIIGLLAYMATYIFDMDPQGNRDKFEGKFDDGEVAVAADIIERINFGDSMENVEKDLFAPLEEYMSFAIVQDFGIDGMHNDYINSPESFASLSSFSQDDKFPVNSLYAEFHNGKLLSVTMNMARQYSSERTGEVVLERQAQLCDAVESKLDEMGYVKKEEIPYYLLENDEHTWSDNNSPDATLIRYLHSGMWDYMSAPYGYEWGVYSNFYRGYVEFTDDTMPGNGKAEYYVNADETKVVAFIREELFGSSSAFDDGSGMSEEARFAPVTVVFYDLEMFNVARDAGDVTYASFASADNVEMYKELNDIGADEFFEKYYGKNR